ncbi:hypothetical protein [Bacillus anthracis]|nr:hypothetical protein [Bacillus anthracis]
MEKKFIFNFFKGDGEKPKKNKLSFLKREKKLKKGKNFFFLKI